MNIRPPGSSIEGVFTIGTVPVVVVPLTVAWDRPGSAVHYIAAGTTYLRRIRGDGSPLPRVLTPDDLRSTLSTLASTTWKRHALVVVDPRQAHAVRVWWSPEWEFGGWYVNLQAPLTRTASGFRTEDHVLDILVAPDRTWRWKDEDELALAVERGRFSPAEAAAIREEGDRVVRRIEEAAFPFDGLLERWRPDPAWPAPALRPAWTEAS